MSHIILKSDDWTEVTLMMEGVISHTNQCLHKDLAWSHEKNNRCFGKYLLHRIQKYLDACYHD